MAVDVLHQMPALMRGQSTFKAQALSGVDLAEQGMAEQFVGQTAGQQALARLVPVQTDQLPKAQRLLRVIEKGLLAQLHFPWLAIKQGDAAEGKLFGAEIQVCQADVAVDHPA
ncbi:hypothetical protein D9M71_652230 [compost metagenome]